MTKKNIVIVGAGFGGIFAAKQLAKKLKHNHDYKIVLIDKHSYFTYQTELHEVATKRVKPTHVQEDLEHIFHKQRNVELLTAEVNGIDRENKIIHTSEIDVPYEKLILAIGGESNDFGTPGVKEHGMELWSMEEALNIRSRVQANIDLGANTLDAEERERFLTVAIVGSGFTGAELMGEMIEWRQVLAAEHKLNPNEIKLVLLEAAPSILNMLKDRNLADQAFQYFENNGVDIRLNARVTSVDENGVIFADGSRLETHNLIWTAGVRAKGFVSKWGFSYGRGGRINVDDYMHVIDDQDQIIPDIYAAGDTVNYVDEKTGPVPQTVEGAENAAKTAVANILHDIKGTPSKKFGELVKYHGFAVSVGSHQTYASLMGLNFSGFFASLAKHAINLYFYGQIRSGYHMFHYFLDEFFRTENGRTPFRGMTSRLGNTLWALPLRLTMGIIFIMAGVGALGDYNTLFNNHGWFGFFEVIIGIGLFSGLLTWICAATATLSIFIAACLHGFDLLYVLLIFGNFALLNGAGRNFGLDHVVVPLLQKFCGQLWYGKVSSRYNEYKSEK